MAQQFAKEIETELGYIVDNEGEIVGTWLWKDGSMTVSSRRAQVKELLSNGLLLEKEVIRNGDVTFEYVSEVYITRFTPSELNSILAPTFYCITNKERKSANVVLPENSGVHTKPFSQVFRGYVMERLRNRDITIGVWFYSPEGIVCETLSRSFNRIFDQIKHKLRGVEFVSKGVKLTPLEFRNATYFDINLALPSRYFLVPSWGVEGGRYAG